MPGFKPLTTSNANICVATAYVRSYFRAQSISLQKFERQALDSTSCRVNMHSALIKMLELLLHGLTVFVCKPMCQTACTFVCVNVCVTQRECAFVLGTACASMHVCVKGSNYRAISGAFLIFLEITHILRVSCKSRNKMSLR